MGFKTIFVIVLSALATIIMMKNTDEVNFWFFGDARISKLAILGTMFGAGLVVGFLAGRPRGRSLKKVPEDLHEQGNKPYNHIDSDRNDYLSDEDREYIR